LPPADERVSAAEAGGVAGEAKSKSDNKNRLKLN